MRRHRLTLRAVERLVRLREPRSPGRCRATRDAGISAIQCGYGCKRDYDGESNTKQDYRCAMLIHGRASEGKSHNAKRMFWFQGVITTGSADARQRSVCSQKE